MSLVRSLTVEDCSTPFHKTFVTSDMDSSTNANTFYLNKLVFECISTGSKFTMIYTTETANTMPHHILLCHNTMVQSSFNRLSPNYTALQPRDSNAENIRTFGKKITGLHQILLGWQIQEWDRRNILWFSGWQQYRSGSCFNYDNSEVWYQKKTFESYTLWVNFQEFGQNYSSVQKRHLQHGMKWLRYAHL